MVTGELLLERDGAVADHPPEQDEAELAEGIAAFTDRRAPGFGWAG
jgi:hypothetical protein